VSARPRAGGGPAAASRNPFQHSSLEGGSGGERSALHERAATSAARPHVGAFERSGPWSESCGTLVDDHACSSMAPTHLRPHGCSQPRGARLGLQPRLGSVPAARWPGRGRRSIAARRVRDHGRRWRRHDRRPRRSWGRSRRRLLLALGRTAERGCQGGHARHLPQAALTLGAAKGNTGRAFR